MSKQNVYSVKKILKGIIILIVFVSIISLFFSVKAKCVEVLEEKAVEKYYESKEKKYVEDVKTYLEGCGFINSGVMLTRIVDIDGTREYKITIHNRKLDKTPEGKREEVREGINRLSFSDENCVFIQEFMVEK